MFDGIDIKDLVEYARKKGHPIKEDEVRLLLSSPVNIKEFKEYYEKRKKETIEKPIKRKKTYPQDYVSGIFAQRDKAKKQEPKIETDLKGLLPFGRGTKEEFKGIWTGLKVTENLLAGVIGWHLGVGTSIGALFSPKSGKFLKPGKAFAVGEEQGGRVANWLSMGKDKESQKITQVVTWPIQQVFKGIDTAAKFYANGNEDIEASIKMAANLALIAAGGKGAASKLKGAQWNAKAGKLMKMLPKDIRYKGELIANKALGNIGKTKKIIGIEMDLLNKTRLGSTKIQEFALSEGGSKAMRSLATDVMKGKKPADIAGAELKMMINQGVTVLKTRKMIEATNNFIRETRDFMARTEKSKISDPKVRESVLKLTQDKLTAAEQWIETIKPKTKGIKEISQKKFDMSKLGTERAYITKWTKEAQAKKYLKFEGGGLPEEANMFEPMSPHMKRFYMMAQEGSPVGKTIGEQIFSGGKTAYNELRYKFIDKFHYIKSYGDLIKGLKWEEHPYYSSRLLAGITGRADAWLMNARGKAVGYEWVKTGKSLKEIYRPIKEIEPFHDYLVARHAVELSKIKPEYMTGIDIKEATNLVKRDAWKFEKHATEWTAYQHALLEEVFDAGIISQELYQKLKTDYADYCPMNRILDKLEAEPTWQPTTKNVLKEVWSPLRKRKKKGSKLPIQDPALSTINATYKYIEATERARISRAIVGLRELHPELAEAIKRVPPQKAFVGMHKGEKIIRPKAKQPPDIMTVWENGNRTYYKVPKDLAKSVGQLDQRGLSDLMRWISLPARTLRTGATTTLGFATRNLFRDQLTAFVNARYGYVPYVDWVRGFFSMLKRDDLYYEWKAMGGEWSMLVTLDKATNMKTLQNILGKKDFKHYMETLKKNPIEPLEQASMYMEMPTRIGVFKRAKQRGASGKRAAFESRRASVDFAVRGALTKAIAANYTFANARLQGMDTFRQAVREAPVKTLAKATAGVGIPTFILYLINRSDPEYHELPQWTRNMFWPMKIKGTWFRIPKGDVGYLFGTSIESVCESLDKTVEGRRTLDKYAKDLIKEVSPVTDWSGFFPVVARPIIENIANKVAYMDKPIVPRGKEMLEKELQTTGRTSPFIKLLARGEISPAKLEHMWNGYTAGLGRYALKMADWMVESTGLAPDVKKPTYLQDYPLMGALTIRTPEGWNSESLNRFYKIMDKMDRFTHTTNALQATNEPNELRKYIEKNETLYIARQSELIDKFNGIRGELNELRKFQSQILNHPEMPVAKKKEIIDVINKQVMQLVIPALTQYSLLDYANK